MSDDSFRFIGKERSVEEIKELLDKYSPDDIQNLIQQGEISTPLAERLQDYLSIKSINSLIQHKSKRQWPRA